MKPPPVSRYFDPICGMWLEAGQVAATFTFIGWTYAFCCEECRELFAQKPDVHVIRLAQDPEASFGHWCPFLRQSASCRTASDDSNSKGSRRTSE